MESNKIDSSKLKTNKLDFIIHEEECNEAQFEYYLPEEISIKSISLKSISFFNSWFTGDFLPGEIRLIYYDLGANLRSSDIKFENFDLRKYCRDKY
uniref:hypothetical protein n=1 Tax=Bartonella sp. CL41QHWL TaxID=3243527 RepID=UPI0035D03660